MAITARQQADQAEADWSIPCLDLVDRKRALRVLRRRSTVVLLSPPGECAVLTADALLDLLAGLTQDVDALRPTQRASA